MENRLPPEIRKQLIDEYRSTIPDKLNSIRQQIDAMYQSVDEKNLSALRFLVHKIAGSAGTYGYMQVSKVCKQFEQELLEKIEVAKHSESHIEWVSNFESYFVKIKEGFSNECGK